MNKNYYILGTSTDVGKTYVAALMVKELNRFNCNIGYYKPCMSGTTITNGLSDLQTVVNVSNIKLSNAKVSFQYDLPLSPHLASKGLQQFDIATAVDDYAYMRKEFDYVVVEGCGGAVCPLRYDNNNFIMQIDLVKQIDIPVILVADAGLGTINATILTIEYLIKNNVTIKGIILNNYDKNNFMHYDNLMMIEKLSHIKVLTTVAKNADSIDVQNIFALANMKYGKLNLQMNCRY